MTRKEGGSRRTQFPVESILGSVRKATFQLDVLKVYDDNLPERIWFHGEFRNESIRRMRKETIDDHFRLLLDFSEMVFPKIDKLFLGIRSNPSDFWKVSDSKGVKDLDKSIRRFGEEYPDMEKYKAFNEQVDLFKAAINANSKEDLEAAFDQIKKKEKFLLKRKNEQPFLYVSLDKQFIEDREVIVPAAYILLPVGKSYEETKGLRATGEETKYCYALLRAGDAVTFFESALALDNGALIFINDLEENNKKSFDLSGRLLEELGYKPDYQEAVDYFSMIFAWHEIGHSVRFIREKDKRYKEKDYWSEFLADSFMTQKVIEQIKNQNDMDSKKKWLVYLLGYLALVAPDNLSTEEIISGKDSDQNRQKYNNSRLRVLKILYEVGIIKIDENGRLDIVTDNKPLIRAVKNIQEYSQATLLKSDPGDRKPDKNREKLFNKLRITPD